MKKKIIIKSGRLLMSGVERILMEVINNINLDKYEIYLVIEEDFGENNVFQKDIPTGINYIFLKSYSFMRKLEEYKSKKKNILYKLLYNIMLIKGRRLVYKNMASFVEKVGKIDAFIDFNSRALKYINKLDVGKKIVWLHISIPNSFSRVSQAKKYIKRLEKYDKIITVSDELKEEVISLNPLLNGKVERIYNPIDINRIKMLSVDDKELTNEQKKIIQSQYIVTVARLSTRQKDFTTLLEGYKIAREKGIKHKLFIIGDGESREEILAEIKRLGLENEVILIGYQENPYIWIRNAELFVLSSKYEGLPTVLLESMVCETPIISSDCPFGPKEILENGKYGILFEVGNYIALGDSIVKLLMDVDLIKDFIEKDKIKISEFNSKNVIKEYELLFD